MSIKIADQLRRKGSILTGVISSQLTTAWCLTLGIVLWTSCVVSASHPTGGQARHPSLVAVDQVKSGGLIEQFGFTISEFKMDHQGERNTLNIIIRYRYKPNLSKDQYPDFTLIAKDIESLLLNYPDKTEYWELVNKRLTLMVLQKYSVLAEITSQIEVAPTPSVRYPRTSIVTRQQLPTRSRART